MPGEPKHGRCAYLCCPGPGQAGEAGASLTSKAPGNLLGAETFLEDPRSSEGRGWEDTEHRSPALKAMFTDCTAHRRWLLPAPWSSVTSASQLFPDLRSTAPGPHICPSPLTASWVQSTSVQIKPVSWVSSWCHSLTSCGYTAQTHGHSQPHLGAKWWCLQGLGFQHGLGHMTFPGLLSLLPDPLLLSSWA